MVKWKSITAQSKKLGICLRDYILSYFFQLSKVRWIKNSTLFSLFFLLILIFVILGVYFYGLEKLIVEFFKLIKIYQ